MSRVMSTPPSRCNAQAVPARSVAKVIEITAGSEKGFEDDVRRGIKRAGESLEGIKAAWIANQEVLVEDNQVHT